MWANLMVAHETPRYSMLSITLKVYVQRIADVTHDAAIALASARDRHAMSPGRSLLAMLIPCGQLSS